MYPSDGLYSFGMPILNDPEDPSVSITFALEKGCCSDMSIRVDDLPAYVDALEEAIKRPHSEMEPSMVAVYNDRRTMMVLGFPDLLDTDGQVETLRKTIHIWTPPSFDLVDNPPSFYRWYRPVGLRNFHIIRIEDAESVVKRLREFLAMDLVNLVRERIKQMESE